MPLSQTAALLRALVGEAAAGAWHGAPAAPWLLHAALPEPSAAGGSEAGPADVTNTYSCHQQKGREKS